MTTKIPPTEPLDEQEREFARIVRALPGGEPPAALDARILRAAANAAAASRRPGARWLASAGALWGIGGAAAAVLALGVSWQMMNPTHAPMREEAAPAAAMADEADDSSVAVEFKDQPQREFDTAGPPPPPAVAKLSAPRPRAQAFPQPGAAPAAPPPPPPAEVAAAPEPFAADQLEQQVAETAAFGYSADSGAGVMAPAPIAAEKAETRLNAAKAVAEGARARKEVELSRADAQRASTASDASPQASASAVGALASEAEAPLLKQADWLTQIRQLRDDNRRAEAKASLLDFRRRYPHTAIPQDLEPLLRE